MTATRNPNVSTWPRLLTAADLAKMPTSLPGGDVRYELDDGVLVAMAPPGGDHGRKQHVVGRILDREAESKGLGMYSPKIILGESERQLPDPLDRLYQPWRIDRQRRPDEPLG